MIEIRCWALEPTGSYGFKALTWSPFEDAYATISMEEIMEDERLS